MLIKSPAITVLSAAGFLLVVINKVQASEEPTESSTDGKVIGKVFEAVKTCLPLVLTIEPSGGPPSNLFRGSCSCSKRGDPSICPQWSHSVNNADITMDQNITHTNDQCVTHAFLKINLTDSYFEKILLKCKLIGYRSETTMIKVQKSGNRQPCLEDSDCRYTQQQCLRDYYAETKVCKCPYANDLFDPSRPDVCVQFIVTESSAEQPGLISVVMIVIIAVLVTGIVLLGFRMIPTTTCCPGIITGHNMDRRSDNTVPFRPMEPPVLSERTDQERVDSPPPYNSLVFANPPAYNESQKNDTSQDPGNSGSTTEAK